MTIIGSAFIKPFYSVSTDMPFGACWKAVDIDGNIAWIWLSHVQSCQNVYRWKFVTWDGAIYKDGEASSIRHCWFRMVDYLHDNPKNGMIPDLERVENFYTGRVDHG